MTRMAPPPRTRFVGEHVETRTDLFHLPVGAQLERPLGRVVKLASGHWRDVVTLRTVPPERLVLPLLIVDLP